MRFNILKTRRGRLVEKIKYELSRPQPNLEMILKHVDDYEKDNLATIDKLKKEKSVDAKKINGALKQAINAHGPITKQLIGSATKRIYGSLISNNRPEKKYYLRDLILSLLTGIIIGVIISFSL